MASLPPKPPPSNFRNAPLPPGWTEHKAPTGHTYYYNAATKTSTYTRPVAQPVAPPPAPAAPPVPGYYGGAPVAGPPATLPYAGPASGYGAAPGAPYVAPVVGRFPPPAVPQPGFNAPRGPRFPPRHHRQPPPKNKEPEDRPKKKRAIPGAEPWLLVTTKMGRKFVHNPETKESLWTAPKEVQEKIDAMPPPDKEAERAARKERRRRRAEEAAAKAEAERIAKAMEEAQRARATSTPAQEGQRGASAAPTEGAGQEEDDDEYEYVEEGEEGEGDEDEPDAKRAKMEDNAAPAEYTEDDIAWQLQAMAEEHELGEEDLKGGEMDPQEAAAIFREMLTEYNVNPYSTWDNELPKFVDDSRYTVLNTTKDRKDVFTEWCKDRIAAIKAEKAAQKQVDPRIPFWNFLKENVNPKFYWAEFKRKHRKEPVMKDHKLTDKEREKMYRDYLARLKTSATIRENDLRKLLKATHGLTSRTGLDELPESVLVDVRYQACPDESRDRLIQDYLRTLPAEAMSEEDRKKKEEEERRQAAMREREMQVKRQQASARYEEQRAKQLLREEEAAIERAKQVGKRGLLGHLRTAETNGGKEETGNGSRE